MPPTEPECEKQFQPYFIPINWETIMKKKDHFPVSKSWGNSTFVLSSYFHLFVYFVRDSSLFNVKLDTEPKLLLSVSQFKAKEEENRARCFWHIRSNFSKSITWEQYGGCSIMMWNQGNKLGNAIVQRKPRKGVAKRTMLYTLCIYMWEVSSWNDIFKLKLYAVLFFLCV